MDIRKRREMMSGRRERREMMSGRRESVHWRSIMIDGGVMKMMMQVVA